MCKIDDAFTGLLNASSITCKVVALGGTEKQKRWFYQKVVDGAFVSMCITEANAGSDVSAIVTTAGRLWLVPGLQCEAVLPQRQSVSNRRRHQPDPAHGHRQRPVPLKESYLWNIRICCLKSGTEWPISP